MKASSKQAFTMIELIFVIVVIGILSAIAIPKLAATRDDAIITKARATVAALRSAIATERQKSILRGVFDDINASTAEALLDYGLGSDWAVVDETFTFSSSGIGSCAFTVSSNRLVRDDGNCDASSGLDDL